MRTFIADIIPKIQRFSKELDTKTLITDQHRVSVGEISDGKKVFIFNKNGEIEIYQNGVEVAHGTWQISSQSLKLRINSVGYLLKNGFLDESIMALKLDSGNQYTFFVNETNYDKDLNSFEDIIAFLTLRYLSKSDFNSSSSSQNMNLEDNDLPNGTSAEYNIKEGLLVLRSEYIAKDQKIIFAILNGKQAPNGRYKLGWMWYVSILNGIVV